ncbi:MAG TPA: hypothetical protein VGN13_02080 [Solirubrobacteraceae bacterium]|jgi:hypothetical protein
MSARAPRSGRTGRAALIAAAVALLALLALSQSASAANTAAWWQLSSSSVPSYLAPGSQGTVKASAANIGYGEVTAGAPVKLIDRLPPNVTITGARPAVCLISDTQEHICAHKEPIQRTVAAAPPCTTSAHEAVCTFQEALAPYERVEMSINVEVSGTLPSPTTSEVNDVTVEGGEVASRSLQQALQINAAKTPFGVEHYELTPETATGEPDRQAGAHPFQFTTSFNFNQEYKSIGGSESPTTPELLRNLRLDLPAGFIGNANKQIIHQCTELQFATIKPNGETNECPADTAIGVATVSVNEPVTAHLITVAVPVSNLVPAKGEPARFGFMAFNAPVTLDTVVREGDYHVVVNVRNASQGVALLSSTVTVWGIPGDPRHDISRGYGCAARGDAAEQGEPCVAPSEHIPAPFLTLPTQCAEPLLSSTRVQSWGFGAQPLEAVGPSSAITLENCGALPFTPAITITPEQHEASTPTGLNVVLKVPQTTTLEPAGLAEANVRDTTVSLPEGVQLSPSAANGLEACSLEQIGFEHPNPGTGTLEFNSTPPGCPDGSKVGTVGVISPDLENELTGSVYLAAENSNPFGSLFGLYIVVEDPITGVLVKLAGRVTLDPTTGRITTDFPNAPQLAFSELKLHLFDGPRASIATPRSCGSFSAEAAFTPWSTGQVLTQTLDPAEFAITSGAGGTPCASPQPFNPGFQAGTTNNQAGAFTPFTLTLARADTDQALKGVSMTLPPGMAGILASVVQCPEPQAEQGTCGEGSLIGRATAVSGLGPDPFTVTGGRVYITGPYHGAPFGLSIVIPAVAGPFNFGEVVTRSTINVNPSTAQLTINSELPTMLNTLTYHTGVPVQLRRVDVTVERPGGAPFQFNPTNCTPMHITGTLTGDQGEGKAESTPFQVTNCKSLPFAPKLTAATAAQASKSNGESLDVNVESAGIGQANIAKVFLTLPKILPSRLSTIQKACLAAVFAANPATCPEGSMIGTATIHTPVLKSALSGPAYLVSYGSAHFPDVEFVLQGEGITLILDGKTDIKNGITYSRFESAPDAPFTRFETQLPAGPHSALTAFVPPNEKYNVCKSAASLVMPTEITAQNGDVIRQTTKIAVHGCKPAKAKKATRAQLLAKALKACNKKHGKAKRAACRKQAYKKYGSKKKAAKKKK